MYALVLDEPHPATAVLRSEQAGDEAAVSLWLYLYGLDAASLPDDWTPFRSALADRVAPTG